MALAVRELPDVQPPSGPWPGLFGIIEAHNSSAPSLCVPAAKSWLALPRMGLEGAQEGGQESLTRLFSLGQKFLRLVAFGKVAKEPSV